MLRPSRRHILNALGTFAAGLCACSTVIMTNIVIKISGREIEYDYINHIAGHFLYSVPFALLFLFNVPMRFYKDRATKKTLVKHLTFTCILCHGIMGCISMQIHLPQDINAYPSFFWFTYGIVAFFLGAANRLDLLIYGAVYLGSIVFHMLSFSDFSMDEKLSLLVIVFQLLHFTPVAILARSRITAIRHAFKQLEKVFYPHQIKMIRKGMELEQTMPTGSAEACVLCFDIINSSKIQHPNVKDSLRNLFARCNTIMMNGYNGVDLVSHGYRIKELGDGFFCSVGFPFQSKSGHMIQDALELAREFHIVFRNEVERLGTDQPIHCCIGIAMDNIAGFYPESGAREYDLHGPAIVLATRYEAMRKSLFSFRPPSSLIILQERVWANLKPDDQSRFIEVDLEEQGLSVRNDPLATHLYYQLLDDSCSHKRDEEAETDRPA